MNRKDKQNQVFKQLVNQQLLPHGKTYEDVAGDPQWYLRYKTTIEAEREFMLWGVDFLRKELKLTKALAENEMSWFILQWGLTTNQEVTTEEILEEFQTSKAKQ